MNNTETLNYIALRARQFRNFLGDNQERVEYYFINFLIVSTNDLVKQKFKSGEINQIQRILESRCVYSLKETELKLKEKLKTIKNFDELTEITSYMNLARKYAVESYQDEVASFHLLGAILDNPPVFIKEFIKKENDTLTVPKEDVEEALKQFNEKPIHKIADGIGKIVAKKEEEIKNNEKITELMRKVNGMSEAITKNVKGQDHAIRAIAEGFFNAELLAESDEKRKRPRATFVFAGPPGVGKTFLAEEMAEYLELDIKRFDMSSYSDSHAAEQLIGQTAVYTNAHTGVLTDYVKANPRCILLFDEVEKAHMNVLYLFYQMLDQGVLEDLKTNEKISFKDTYIIFTTNAGHNLYEGKEDENLSLMSKKKIMNGLTKDINPITKEPFFPTALCSRLAAGTVVMFNHLQSHNLLEISQSVLEKSAKMFNDQYHIDIEFDNRIASLLMYKEGGMVDARTLRGQCDAFFKSQILNCLELFDLEKIESVLSVFNKIKFYAEDFDDIEDLDDVFKQPKHKEVLFYGNDSLGKSLSHYMEEYSWNIVSDEQEAMDIFSKKDIQVALLDVMSKEEAKRQKNKGGTIYAFDNVSVSSQSFDKARSFVEQTTKRFPEVPIYLIDKGLFKIDEQLKMKLIQLGVRGIVDSKDYKVTTYKKIIDECLDHSHIQLIANHLKSKHLMMKYEISYKLLKEEKELHVRTRKYTLGEYIDPEDEEHLVSDAQRPTIKFDDVIGAEDAKEELKFFIDYLKNPKSFIAKGLKPAKGVLFYGPPGTGKTMLAKAMAGETDITFISESATNFVTKYVGSGPQAVRDMFKRARRYAPTILFIDEIDAIGRTRTGASNTHAEETTLNALLTEMDGFKVDLKRPVFIIAATNFKVAEGSDAGQGYIDPALVRRFDRKLKIDILNKKERYQLFDLLLKKAKNNQVTQKMMDSIADRSIGRNSSNLSDIVSSAVSLAEKRNSPITDEIFEEAFETFIYGKVNQLSYDHIQRTAWHEAGHAYMYWKNGQIPSYLTIVSRGNHGGYMQFNDSDASSAIKTQEELLRNIRVSLAGRACELVRFGKADGTSTGISSDLAQATRIAKAMICNYGMDDDIGLIYIDENMAQSSEIAMMIHKKTVEILNQEMKNTITDIKDGYDKISRLVDILLQKNSLNGEEIDKILKGE